MFESPFCIMLQAGAGWLPGVLSLDDYHFLDNYLFLPLLSNTITLLLPYSILHLSLS